jgi:hypothetical protein
MGSAQPKPTADDGTWQPFTPSVVSGWLHGAASEGCRWLDLAGQDAVHDGRLPARIEELQQAVAYAEGWHASQGSATVQEALRRARDVLAQLEAAAALLLAAGRLHLPDGSVCRQCCYWTAQSATMTGLVPGYCSLRQCWCNDERAACAQFQHRGRAR